MVIYISFFGVSIDLVCTNFQSSKALHVSMEALYSSTAPFFVQNSWSRTALNIARNIICKEPCKMLRVVSAVCTEDLQTYFFHGFYVNILCSPTAAKSTFFVNILASNNYHPLKPRHHGGSKPTLQ